MATMLEQEFTVDYLDPEHINLFTNPNGIVCMEYKGTVYWKLSARRALPHQNREEFIFLYNYSDSEIGAIKALKELPREQRDMVNNLLDKRYFTREIKSIYSIIDKFSVLIFKVKTDLKEEVEFTVIRPKDNIYRSKMGGFLISDVDKNMYHVPTREILSYKDIIRIERYC